jgi:signal transduction histidine kinase
MNFKSIRLLTKTTFIYLVFILIAFFSTAAFIIERTNNFIDEDTENYFHRRERRLVKYIEESENHISHIRDLVRIDISIIDTSDYPKFRDTTMVVSQMDDPMLFRAKTILVNTSKGHFEYMMYKNISDFDKFRQGVLGTITNTFILLVLVLTLFSLFLSGFLFRAFHRILGSMSKYKIGSDFKLPDVRTSTTEFKKMQLLVGKMISQIESDYRKLKEYTENMAHEMQTPLAIIRSKAELLIADEKMMDEHSKTIKVIYDEATHLSNLGNTLNLLTKIENGEYDKVEELKTYDIISRHIDAVKEMFQLKGLVLNVSLDSGHTLYLDPLLFDVMIKNLLKNALRYGLTVGPVTITTDADKLIISNYGSPLPFDSSKIFNRFVGSNGAKSALGLGLALVKRICDLNQLTITYNFHNAQHTFTIQPVAKQR